MTIIDNQYTIWIDGFDVHKDQDSDHWEIAEQITALLWGWA